MRHRSDNKEPKVWTPALVFLIDTLVGVAIFLVIAAGAVFLGFAIKYLQTWKVDPVVITFLKACEYMILVADGVMLARYLFVSVKRGWQDL